jgi:hypothetical protein
LYDRLTEACVRPPGMGHLEDARLTGDLTVARDFDLGMTGPPLSISMDFIAGGLVEMIAGLTSALVLAAYAWWAPIVLGGAWLATHWLLRESGVWRDRNTDAVKAAHWPPTESGSSEQAYTAVPAGTNIDRMASFVADASGEAKYRAEVDGDLLSATELLGPQQLSDLTRMKPYNVRYLLGQMVQDGEAMKATRGRYYHPDRSELSDTPSQASQPHN